MFANDEPEREVFSTHPPFRLVRIGRLEAFVAKREAAQGATGYRFPSLPCHGHPSQGLNTLGQWRVSAEEAREHLPGTEGSDDIE